MCLNDEKYIVIRNDIYSDIYSELDIDLDLDNKSYIYINLFEDTEAEYETLKKCDKCINEDVKYERLINDIYEIYSESFLGNKDIKKDDFTNCSDKNVVKKNTKSFKKKLRNLFKKRKEQ